MEWDRYYDIFDALGYVDYLASECSVIVYLQCLSKIKFGRQFKQVNYKVL